MDPSGRGGKKSEREGGGYHNWELSKRKGKTRTIFKKKKRIAVSAGTETDIPNLG